MGGTRQVDGPGRDGCCAAPDLSGPPAEPAELDDEQLAGMAKALGHPLRVRILRLLVERRACVTGDLVAELPVAQSTVSEHLRILREAGLVQGEIEGPRTAYCVSPAGLAAFKHAVAGL
ncbi:ArsR/SmtB family transcription factor [Rhabdothermincola sediminis]|uniref:ArsR/SmtB family transcription factor n=1 Tax=Rhabdothermincola sediminis TaxID=2751370 RepID=UPI001AA021B7|nr:metalloregulator ArsR/SmtB family transcription factor [Rhabdothermincola sediminis]